MQIEQIVENTGTARHTIASYPVRAFRRASASAVLMSWMNLSSRLVGLVVLVPLALRNLNLEEFVIWQVFLSIVAFAAALDFGLSPTLSRFISYKFGGDKTARDPDWTAIKSIFELSKWAYGILAVSVFVVLVTVGTSALDEIIGRSPDPTTATIAWYLVVMGTSLQVFGLHQVALLQGLQKIPIQQKTQCIAILFASVSAGLVLLLGGGLFWFIAVYLTMVPIAYVRNRIVIKQILLCEAMPSIEERVTVHRSDNGLINFVRLNLPLIKDIWASTWRSGLGVFVLLGFAHGCGIAMANIFPASIAAAGLLSFQVMRAVNTFSAVPFMTRMPLMSAAFAQNNEELMKSLANEGTRKSYLVFTILAVGFLVFGNKLILMANPGVVVMSAEFLSVLSIAILLERYGAMHMQMMTVRNIVTWHKANGMTVVVSISLIYFLVNSNGIIAFPLAMLVGNVVAYCFYIAQLSYRKNSLRFPQFEISNWFISSLIILLCICGLTVIFY